MAASGGGDVRAQAAKRAVRGAMFSTEGPDQYDRAFGVYAPFAHTVRGSYQTALGGREAAFRRWVQQYRVPFDVNAKTVDYDMRGFWKASGGRPYGGGHFPDTFKTPYDTTFSRESMYATRRNPFVWRGDYLVDRRSGRVMFDPNLRGAEVASSRRGGVG